jgi:hypothetical protein
MEPITLTLAGLTGAAAGLSLMLALRSLRRRKDSWGENIWGTSAVVDDSFTFRTQQEEAQAASGPSWFNGKKKERARRILTDAMPSDRLIPQVHAIGHVPPPDQF